MCGLVYVKRLDGKDAGKMVAKRYRNQKARGSEGFGFIGLENGIMQNYVRSAEEKEILEALEQKGSSEIIFHHRFPTSTPNFAEVAHPIRVSHKSLKHDYYVIHNGIIYNDDELKTAHEVMGFTYQTEIRKKWRSNGNTIFESKKWNDSESLAIELALAIEQDKDRIDTKGSIAVIVLQVAKHTKKATKLFYGRNHQNPLKLEIVKDQFITLSSECGGEMIEANTLFSFDYETKQMDARKFTFGEGYTYQSSYEDEYSTTKSYMGYNGKYTEPDVDEDEDEYWALKEELSDLELFLAKAKDENGYDLWLGDYDYDYAIDRIEEIEQRIGQLDEQAIQRACQLA